MVPLVARELDNRDSLGIAVAAGLAAPYVAYASIGVAVALCFGADVARSANTEWEIFGGFGAATTFLRVLVVLFRPSTCCLYIP